MAKEHKQKQKTKFTLPAGQHFVAVGRDGVSVTVGVQRMGAPTGHPKPPGSAGGTPGGTGGGPKNVRAKMKARHRRFKEKERRERQEHQHRAELAAARREQEEVVLPDNASIIETPRMAGRLRLVWDLASI